MKKIDLKKETLRVLSSAELRNVAGGVSRRDDCNPTDTCAATGCGGGTVTSACPAPTSPEATCPAATSPEATCPGGSTSACPIDTTPMGGCPLTTRPIRSCPQ
jgi:hypothetical protein